MLGNLYEDKDKKQAAYRLAARGDGIITSARYYNDQPPEMMFYAAKAIEQLGDKGEAHRRFDGFIDFANQHINDEIRIDYFAVSLPDFLIFEADLNKKNKVHCSYMAALGYFGKCDLENARKWALSGLELDKCHAGLNDVLHGIG